VDISFAKKVKFTVPVSSEGSKQLGDIHLKTKITNIETNKSMTLNLLVDTGATMTVLYRQIEGDRYKAHR